MRVVNGARSATLSLSAGSGVLRLRAVRPGTREFLRASVDYDNIPEEDTEQFNLTVQRGARARHLPGGGSGDIPPAVGAADGRGLRGRCRCRFRAGAPGPASRRRSGPMLPWTRPAGSPSAMRRRIGRRRRSALERLRSDRQRNRSDRSVRLGSGGLFQFPVHPAAVREQDVGPSALLVGARYCKERRALLIVDPPSRWHTADDALAGMRDWNFSNENALMYFPRVLAHDKLRGHFESFAPGGAIAACWRAATSLPRYGGAAKPEDAVLRPGYRPTCLVTEDRRAKLASFGVNTLQAVRSANRSGPKPRTLGAGAAASAEWQQLPARRLALFILNSIERGTRWVVLAQPHVEVAESAISQVREFFEGLHAAGAFGARRMEEAFFRRDRPSGPERSRARFERRRRSRGRPKRLSVHHRICRGPRG